MGARLEQTISLYLDLKPGEKADFEVVGRTTAAFATVVKEIAFIINPAIEVKLEFDSGTPGSLSLKGLLKGEGSPATYASILVLVGGWFVADLRAYGVSKLLDRLLTAEQRQALSDEDIDRLARRLKEVETGKLAKEQAQEVYRQIERDEAITHVGTVTKSGAKPENPVPREQFAERAGMAPAVETTPSKRKKVTRERLTLISPVLLPGGRLWKFRSGNGEEIGYAIKDEKFLKSLLTGRRRIPMKAGIQITATVETHETKSAEVWEITERWITEVHRVHRAESKPDLFAAPKTKKRKASQRKKRQA